jgi:hypothetical protein
MKLEQTECSETSAYKIQTPGNYPEENIQHSQHGESLKSRISFLLHKEHNPPPPITQQPLMQFGGKTAVYYQNQKEKSN